MLVRDATTWADATQALPKQAPDLSATGAVRLTTPSGMSERPAVLPWAALLSLGLAAVMITIAVMLAATSRDDAAAYAGSRTLARGSTAGPPTSAVAQQRGGTSTAPVVERHVPDERGGCGSRGVAPRALRPTHPWRTLDVDASAALHRVCSVTRRLAHPARL